MGISYGQPFVGVEAEDAVYIRKSADSVPSYRRGTWYGDSVVTCQLTDNPSFNVSPYSFCMTVKRVANNPSDYTLINWLGYHVNISDHFYFGIQTRNAGNNQLQAILRLNNYSTAAFIDLPVGSTAKIVGTYDGSTGYFWINKSSYLVTVSPVTRPLNTRSYFLQTLSSSDLQYTNVGWWLRVLTTAEKDAYFDGTMGVFQ